jgi:hypothetical protein
VLFSGVLATPVLSISLPQAAGGGGTGGAGAGGCAGGAGPGWPGHDRLFVGIGQPPFEVLLHHHAPGLPQIGGVQACGVSVQLGHCGSVASEAGAPQIARFGSVPRPI